MAGQISQNYTAITILITFIRIDKVTSPFESLILIRKI